MQEPYFMNNQKISARQVKRTLTLELLGISTLLLPSLVATDSGVDGFFALTAGGGGAWLLLKFWQKHFRQQDFSQRLEQMSGCVRVCIQVIYGMGFLGLAGFVFYVMAALMEQPVKFIWTHDAFRVGEDGPTHEPVEQEAQIRLMEKLKNHKGHNSMLVLRPADAEETTIAWKLAMENMSTPTGLIFSRQNIANLPAGTDYEQAAKGAYIVAGSDENPDVILVASGSEVSTLVAGTELLRKDGVKVRIVSAPSEGLFRSQSKEYQESVLPADAKIFGLTAGLPVTLQGLVGCHGKVWGLESFGFSAPYTVLDEKLGFTAENVYNQVKAMI